MRARTAFSQFLGVFGVAGAVGQLAVLASALAYSREQENDADRIGLELMRSAGYDPEEAARVWRNLLLERNAQKDARLSSFPLFATHPAAEERKQTLATLARQTPGGDTHASTWREIMKPHLRGWLIEEVRRGRHDETIALLTRMLEEMGPEADLRYARGETFRQRAQTGDLDSALEDFQAAVLAGGEPPETHRALGLIYKSREQSGEAIASLRRYLELAPDAPDAGLIRSQLEELGT